MSGMGEKYSFYDSETLNSESDPLRTEFGSVWTEDNSSFWDSWKPDQLPSFGISTNPKFDIEFGPIVVTKSESAPYIAHHQSIRLIANSRNYKNPDCIDCGFHDDVRAALTSRFDNLDHSIVEQFFQMAYQKYSSFGPIPMVAGFVPPDLLGGPSGTPLSDCFHDMSTPLNEEDIRLAAAIGASVDEYMLGTTSFEYGDYVEKLEQVLLNLDEKDIPNFYLLMSLMAPMPYSSGEVDYPGDLGSDWSSFFNQAADYLMGNICQDTADQIKEETTGFTELLVSAPSLYNDDSGASWIDDMAAYREYFSLRAETQFSTDQGLSDIADAIKSVNLDCRFLRWMTAKRSETNQVPTYAMFEKLADADSLLFMNNSSADTINIRTYDLFKFCGTDGEDVDELSVAEIPAEVEFIGENDSTQYGKVVVDFSEADIYDTLWGDIATSHIMFSNLLTQALEGHTRTYQDLFLGEKPYSETIAYKISKYKKSDLGPTDDQLEIIQRIIENDTQAIQNVWLANSSGDDVIGYIDTQMKYNENYVIIVWAYNLVLGSRYFYSNLRTSESDTIEPVAAVYTAEEVPGIFLGNLVELADAGWTIGDTIQPTAPSGDEFCSFTTSPSFTLDIEDDCEAAFAATTLPMAAIKEVPFFFYQGSVIDNPPIVPDIRLVTHYGNDSELLVLMNNSAGTDFVLEPEIINLEDQDVFDTIRSAQALLTGEIEFGSDNPVESYQVYRMTDFPSSYTDFADNLLTTVSTVYSEGTGKKANAASYIDSIAPNTKYYYTFRSIDIHEHFSNPTAVYEVELVSADGTIVPYIRTVEMTTPPTRDTSKSVKSVFHIVPRITQAVVGENLSNLDGTSAKGFSEANRPALGAETEALWGKSFKIRLTSRNTKRTFDINVTFDTEYVVAELDSPLYCAPSDSSPVPTSKLGAAEDVPDSSS